MCDPTVDFGKLIRTCAVCGRELPENKSQCVCGEWYYDFDLAEIYGGDDESEER